MEAFDLFPCFMMKFQVILATSSELGRYTHTHTQQRNQYTDQQTVRSSSTDATTNYPQLSSYRISNRLTGKNLCCRYSNLFFFSTPFFYFSFTWKLQNQVGMEGGGGAKGTMTEQPWTGTQHTFTFQRKQYRQSVGKIEQVVPLTCLHGAAEINVIGKYSQFIIIVKMNGINGNYRQIASYL